MDREKEKTLEELFASDDESQEDSKPQTIWNRMIDRVWDLVWGFVEMVEIGRAIAVEIAEEVAGTVAEGILLCWYKFRPAESHAVLIVTRAQDSKEPQTVSQKRNVIEDYVAIEKGVEFQEVLALQHINLSTKNGRFINSAEKQIIRQCPNFFIKLFQRVKKTWDTTKALIMVNWNWIINHWFKMIRYKYDVWIASKIKFFQLWYGIEFTMKRRMREHYNCDTRKPNIWVFEVSFDSIIYNTNDELLKLILVYQKTNLNEIHYVLAPYYKKKIPKEYNDSTKFHEYLSVIEPDTLDPFDDPNDPNLAAIDMMRREGYKLVRGHLLLSTGNLKMILFDIEGAREEVFNRFRFDFNRNNSNANHETPSKVIPDRFKGVSLDVLLNDMAVFEFLVSRYFTIFHSLNNQQMRASGIPKPVYIHRTMKTRKKRQFSQNAKFYCQKQWLYQDNFLEGFYMQTFLNKIFPFIVFNFFCQF